MRLFVLLGVVFLLTLPSATDAGERTISVREVPGRAVSAGASLVDLVADRALLLAQPDGGTDIEMPAVGEEVYAHLVWRALRIPPGGVSVDVEARLDGARLCGGSVTPTVLSQTTWCSTPWTVTAGEHTLEWVLDPGDVIVEEFEFNNRAERVFVSASVATPTPPINPSPASPTGTPTGTPTSTPTIAGSLSPSPTFAPGEFDVFSRGDTNCSLTPSAADVVAQVFALADTSVCDNDDCDRDGDLDEGDLACVASCLFGKCAVPPGAPRILSVEALSTAAVRPLSLIRVVGVNLGDSEVILGINVGELRGDIVSLEGPDSVLALMPNIEPGTRALTVFVGEIESPPFEVEVGAGTAIGDPDTLDDVVDGVTALIEMVLALDTTVEFGPAEELVLSELTTLGIDLPAAVALLRDGSGFTAEFSAELDRLIDSSGTPELLRDSLTSLAGGGTGAGVGPNGTILVQAGRTAVAAGRVVAAAATAAAQTAAVTLDAASTATAGAAVGAVVAAAGAVLVVGAAGAVLIQDAPIVTTIFPAIVQPGDRLTVFGSNLGGFFDLEPNLVLRNRNGQEITVFESIEVGDDLLGFRVPDASGACGRMDVYLRVPFLGTASPFSRSVLVRQVLDAAPSVVSSPAENHIDLEVRAVVGCEGRSVARFRATEGEMRDAPFTLVASVLSRNLVRYGLRKLYPGRFAVRLDHLFDLPLGSFGSEQLIVDTSLTDLDLVCPRAVQMGGPVARCRIDNLFEGGRGETRFTVETVDAGGLQPDNILRIAPDTQRSGLLAARGPGRVRVLAELRRVDGGLDRFVGRSQEGVVVEVRDEILPTVRLERSAGTPENVVPGQTIQVLANGEDNHSIAEIELLATGPIAPPDTIQLFDCNPVYPITTTGDCMNVFALPVVTGVGDTIVLTATAIDESGNRSTPAELVFGLSAGDIGGTVFNARGGDPIPGATIQLIAAGGQIVGELVSGGGGYFFGDVPAGRYTVRAFADGFRPVDELIDIAADDDVDLPLFLEPLDGPGRLSVRVNRREPGGTITPVAAATVTVLDRDLFPLAQAATNLEGVAEISGLPVGEYAWLAGGPDLAQGLRRFDISGGGRVSGTADLYVANPSCSSELSHFKVTSGRIQSGNQLTFFDLDADEVFQPGTPRLLHSPDAAVVCVTGNAARPTIDWHGPWADAILSQSVDRVRLIRTPIGGNPATLFDLTSDGAISPPVVYGDTSQGVDIGPFADSTPPDLESGENYTVNVDGIGLRFERR